MKKILASCLVVALFISCNKNKDDDCTLSTNAVSGNHRITAVRYKATPAAAEVDYYTSLYTDPCERDDVFNFNSNGTYVFTDAGIVCSPSNSDNGTWSLSGNTVTIDGDPANVDNFNCTTLTVSMSDFFVVGDKITIVFTRQ